MVFGQWKRVLMIGPEGDDAMEGRMHKGPGGYRGRLGRCSGWQLWLTRG